ncbi:MAG: hypothetical protein II994_09420 [Lachnospiraceae bacterium]|nr:hypothetical protein [Lachnospiraceae bacterium]
MFEFISWRVMYFYREYYLPIVLFEIFLFLFLYGISKKKKRAVILGVMGFGFFYIKFYYIIPSVLFYLILYLPLILFGIFLFLFLRGIVKKKKRAVILGAVGFILVSLQIVNRMQILGNIGSETKAKGTEFQIVQMGTGSMGSRGNYIMEPEGILVEVDEISEGSSITRFGWKYQAVAAGECMVLVHQFDCADFWDVNAYRVTVDENLNVSYEQKSLEYPGIREIEYFDDSDYNRSKKITIVDENGTRYIEDSVQLEEIREKLLWIVGKNIKCQEPIEDNMTKMVLLYERGREDYEREDVIYITQEGTLYYKGSSWDRERGTHDQWYYFVPDEWSKASYKEIIEGIN